MLVEKIKNNTTNNVSIVSLVQNPEIFKRTCPK